MENNKNKLKNETSPYLLQHADNPVNWYPWGQEAFDKAKVEGKPIFLSIGYSTCHWCHVMAHESFEDKDVARLLNNNFISIKVDREERPDIDAVYMSICQSFTGNGGWPMTIFMTSDQKPFFAGTYFPKESQGGMVGFIELVESVLNTWRKNKKSLDNVGDTVIALIKSEARNNEIGPMKQGNKAKALVKEAEESLTESFDSQYGGFGSSPKFPMGHNLLFLMDAFEFFGHKKALEIVEHTLTRMYKGGIFDHIGYGFSRYSTDRFFLVPHFEKMLYDNAILLSCYARAYGLTKRQFYADAAAEVARYVEREMTSEAGGFYSSQDADSQGEEGKFYTFEYDEIISILGPEDGKTFNSYFGVTPSGNFEGKNILNLLGHEVPDKDDTGKTQIGSMIKKIYDYRKSRYKLHTDDKILLAWNSLMIGGFCNAYRYLGEKKYLEEAQKGLKFILENMCDENSLFVSHRLGQTRGSGFIDEYGFFVYALITLYEVTSEKDYLEKAVRFCREAIKRFFDKEKGGFYYSGAGNETLILNIKETHDGAMPSGNSVMAYNLVKLSHYTGEEEFAQVMAKQMDFMCTAADGYPAGHCFFMSALAIYIKPEIMYTCRDGYCGPAPIRPERGEKQ